jgi:hypothetical protein
MRKSLWLSGTFLVACATVSHAGIPITNKHSCPVGGQKFESVGTASCSTFGLTQDFYFRRPSSCDFVTRLPQCPDNKLPLYKEFSKEEIAWLKGYLGTADYQAVREQSRFYIAKKVDDFLVSKGSTPTMDFGYLLGGLQHDRANTETNPEYRQWVIEAAQAHLAKAKTDDAPFIRLILAYTHYLGAQFDEASLHVQAVKDDPATKDKELLRAYVARMEECLTAKDVKLCPSSDQVVRQAKQS